jgi:hypothetical protein
LRRDVALQLLERSVRKRTPVLAGAVVNRAGGADSTVCGQFGREKPLQLTGWPALGKRHRQFGHCSRVLPDGVFSN